MGKFIIPLLRWCFVGILFIGLPLVAVLLNRYFSLFVIDSFYLKCVGAALCGMSVSVVTYLAVQHLKTGRTTWLPVVEEPKRFMARGLYLYSRNPMYLLETLFLVGVYFLFGYILLLVYALGFFLAVHLFVIYIEEPELKKILGEEYKRYMKNVPRWILV